MSSIRRLYEDLRSISVAVVHPPGEDRELLIEQLKRIGCRLQVFWPYCTEPPRGADVVFFHLSQGIPSGGMWCASATEATLIALSDYESPTTLKLLLDSSAHGVLTKPFRSSGVLSTLVLARSAQGFQQRQQAKIQKLEATIKSRRQIDKAIKVLVDHQGMDEVKAYEHMRARATSLRVTVAEVAAMVIDAQEVMEKLGLGRGR